MLGQIDAIPDIAVKDIDRAKKRFYADTLGLPEVSNMNDHVITYRSGKTLLNVYVSDYAGTNQANAVSWAVGDRLRALSAR